MKGNLAVFQPVDQFRKCPSSVADFCFFIQPDLGKGMRTLIRQKQGVIQSHHPLLSCKSVPSQARKGLFYAFPTRASTQRKRQPLPIRHILHLLQYLVIISFIITGLAGIAGRNTQRRPSSINLDPAIVCQIPAIRRANITQTMGFEQRVCPKVEPVSSTSGMPPILSGPSTVTNNRQNPEQFVIRGVYGHCPRQVDHLSHLKFAKIHGSVIL